MPKIKRSLQTWSGKMGELVYVNSPTYGSYTRKTVAPGTKKDEPGIKEQYTRTVLLNGIASDVNTVVKNYAGSFKPSKFYERVQSLIRGAPVDDRYILLKQLRGMEVHPEHSFESLCSVSYSSAYTKKTLSITLTTEVRPLAGEFRADSYSYAVIVTTWGKAGREVDADCQWTEWVPIKDKKPVFEFEFERPAASKHWLLCVQVLLGKNEERIENMKAEGMQVIDAGSFDKRDLALFEKYANPERVKGKKAVKEEVVVRVKRKG
jgi:hypothetical protein